ncbi:TIM barrel protein [Mollicutes bacterium LVI A0039]|nr:TIM barrel protein [Mollicutes bacterium LVI A0039]
MKIGVRPHDLSFSTTQELCEICKELGIDGLQLVSMKIFEDKFWDQEFIDQQINMIRSNGIDIFLLGSYFNMIHPNLEKLESGIKVFEENTKTAKRNKISNIGSETGSVNGDDWTYNPLNHQEESYAKLEKTIDQVTSKLDEQYYLLEPVYDHVAHNLELTKRMMRNDRVAITLDLANLLNVENHQSYLKIFEAFLAEFGSKIKIFHFKNFVIANNQKQATALDKGIIDYQQIYELVIKYKLDDIPVIVEELQGKMLEDSIKYLRSISQ